MSAAEPGSLQGGALGPADLERFRRAFDVLREGVLFLERGGVTSYANPAAVRIFGPEMAQRAALAPALRLEVSDEQGQPVNDAPGMATLRDGQPRERVPLRLRRTDGSVIWVEVSSAVLAADVRGAPETVVLLCIDITEERAREQARARAEAARRTSDRRYRALFDNLSSAFALHEVVTDDAGAVIDYVWLEVNPAYQRMTGRTAAELIGRRVREVLPGTEAEWEERLGKIARVALGGESLSHEDFVARSGRWFENWAFSPGPRQVATLVTETTERHRVADAVAASEARYRALADASVDMISRHDLEGRYLYASPAAESILGRKPESLLGTRAVDYVHPEDRAASARALNASGSEGGLARAEFRVARPDGSLCWVESISRVVKAPGAAGAAGAAGASEVMVSTRDISAQKRMEGALRELNASLERRVAERTADLAATNLELEAFSYSVSHDLRAPLRAIDGYTRAIEEDHGAALPEEARRSFARIQAASQRLSSLIDVLLQLSRSSRAELVRAPVDLSALAHEVMDTLRRAEPQRQVEVEIAPGLSALADAALARTVLENLLGNAWKYTGRRERAHVWFERGPSPGTFCVRDDGAGFDMAYADKLFGAFQRLHAADDFPGNGVGLATTRRILARHGGAIEARGEPGRGARFTFSFGG